MTVTHTHLHIINYDLKMFCSTGFTFPSESIIGMFHVISLARLWLNLHRKGLSQLFLVGLHSKGTPYLQILDYDSDTHTLAHS